ncbi:rRNA maturation RNase YbeY [Brevundimonas sp. BAL450]|jgi:probable rRNA maturation factor|uniref:Endoribonuclease YbeY n=1 Tax=Brevundimonas abyssalis TAR-001 TaxID=1391729 RepID=A0A8E0NBY7_9CAUL|nr:MULTISPECIES: rRNA maturation RNase YbeY [Brevundimonas]MBG7616226.1 rRNA maturation RNase YbeY [Brevundimonas sp. BAL450]GAD59555.1 metal-dependent hydrolase [Brevundimonas abyssalis TAR-001]
MIDIEVEDDAWSGSVPDVQGVVSRAAEQAAPPGDVVILLTDDETVRELNARFRGKDRPTNVLSFPAPENARPHLGDIVLAHGVCAAEARDQGKPFADHLSHLVIHGLLHLTGHDHEADDEAEAMEAQERTLLAALGIPDPYLSRNDT